MKIIYIGAFRLPNLDAAASRVLNIARALRLAGHEISFISWGGEQRESDLCEHGVYRVDGFEYEVTGELDVKGSTFSKLKGWLQRGNYTKLLLQRRIGTYDAIITYNGSIANWLISFCKRNNIHLICDLTEWYDNNELKLIEKPGYYIKMYRTLKRVENKIVISSFLDSYYLDSNNIIVPATCDSSEKKWQPEVIKPLSIVGTYRGKTLIYAGNPARKDAVHYAIRAVQRLSREGENIRFLILGITREQYLQRYCSLLLNTSLSKSICFLGKVSQEDVPSFYTLADFMILLRENTRKSNAGFPTKFAESFTTGTPVIANLTSDLDDYLKDGETGFVVDDPNEESVYKILKEKVLPLTKEDIEEMKRKVQITARLLDYHTYVEPLRSFMDNLR